MSTAKDVFVKKWNAHVPLGKDITTLFNAMLEGKSSCQAQPKNSAFPEPFCASLFDANYPLLDGFSKLETMLVHCLAPIIDTDIARSKETVFIFSSTKGNIDVLNGGPIPDSAFLWHTAQKIARYFGNPNKPFTVSNACVSGVMAQNTAFDLIRHGMYTHAIVFGADCVSAFVLSGFGSFKAMSAQASKPFDANRVGINLGEGAGAIVLSAEKGEFPLCLTGTGSSNDANHISGPSRTGDGLLISILSALHEAGVLAHEIDYLSAHGTATPYNDEMESLAFADAGLSQVPLNSMKGYFGHTLGAAGLIETAVLLESMKRGLVLPSLGFETYGVSGQINVNQTVFQKPIRKALKTGSGFGGCNAATVFEWK